MKIFESIRDFDDKVKTRLTALSIPALAIAGAVGSNEIAHKNSVLETVTSASVAGLGAFIIEVGALATYQLLRMYSEGE